MNQFEYKINIINNRDLTYRTKDAEAVAEVKETFDKRSPEAPKIRRPKKTQHNAPLPKKTESLCDSGTLTSAPPPAIGGNGGCTSVSGNTSNVPGNMNMPAAPQGTNEAGPTRTRASENRRSNKPIMEKRRRARINNCLNELKTLILDAMKKDPARHSKLEKADILEMTVKHLEALQRQQVAMAAASDPNVANKFRAGFTECAGEVGRFPGLDGPIKRRLLQHLANCLNSTSPPTTPAAPNPATDPTPATANPPLQVHILRTPVQNDASIVQQGTTSNIILANTNGQGVQLVPTRLPNGDIALILPSSNSFRTARAPPSSTPSASPSPSISSNSSGSSPLPMLIPIPSNGAASSPPPVAIDRLSMSSSTPPRQITILTTQNPQRILIPQNSKEKSIPLYAEGSGKVENMIQQRVIIPEAYIKPEKVMKAFDEVPVIHEMHSAYMKARKEDAIENNYGGSGGRPVIEESLYDRNRIIMTHEGQIIESEHPARYVGDKMYSPERETLLHIPERDFYETGPQSYSPQSPVGYIENIDGHTYGGYYGSHLERPYSPDVQKPLALVTKKKCEEYDSEEKPWRPW